MKVKARYNTANQNVWFTSDTHFCHANIMKYCKRPFKSVHEMNEAIVDNWNRHVNPNDVVFHLGDVCFSRNSEEYADILSRLRGKIHLVIGNHDDPRMLIECEDLFEHIWGIGVILKVNKIKIQLSHYPYRAWDGSHHGSWHLYGHHHGSIEDHGFSTDVGVDTKLANYSPVSFDTIQNYMIGKGWTKDFTYKADHKNNKSFQNSKLGKE